jgi:peptide subunit release factor 1 (eRF1)
MSEMTERILSRRKVLDFLDGQVTSGEISESYYIPAGSSVVDRLGLSEEALALAAKSKTGVVIFRTASRHVVILPPFPVKEQYLAQGFEANALRVLLTREYKLALILVRLGAYAVGWCEGEKLVASKVGTGLIHAWNKKGGSSAQRYGLHREKQIEAFVSRICGHIREHIEPRAKALDYAVYGGSREALLALKKGCPLLAKFEDRALPPLLDIPDPNQATLEKVVRRIWTSRLFEFSITHV